MLSVARGKIVTEEGYRLEAALEEAVDTDAATVVSGTLVRDDSGDQDLPPRGSAD